MKYTSAMFIMNSFSRVTFKGLSVIDVKLKSKKTVRGTYALPVPLLSCLHL
jgi:hypothetical protein